MSRLWTIRSVVALLLCLTACATSPEGEVASPSTDAAPQPQPTTSPAAPPAPATPQFSGTVSVVTAADMPASWRTGCPVGPDALRRVQVSFWDFAGQARAGSLVVNVSAAEAMIDVFRKLYAARFPIRRMEPIDAFGGDDAASIAADNTSAFNCRNAVSTGPPHWSMHAYGLAIDVNPVENPYLLDGKVLPPAGADYLDRNNYRPGMAVEGGVLTSAFAAIGWQWGGRWASPDYQHFSSTGS